jgi:hypothetical protein
LNQIDKLWHQQYEQLVEFRGKNGHCLVPRRSYDKDTPLGNWVRNQRASHKNNKIRPDRKRILDEIGFAWKHYTLAVASTNHVRGPVIGKFHALLARSSFSLYNSSCSAYLCRIRSRKRSPAPAVWVSQTKHQHPKNRNQHEATLEIFVQFPTERDQVPALPKPDKWPLL